MAMSDGGKGSTPRPFSISQDEYASRWDAIFQRDLPKEEKPEEEVVNKEENEKE